MVTRFEELKCWKEARILVVMVVKACSTPVIQREFGFKDQIKRAALSVMNNIAEGFARYSQKEFIRFLNIAQSSCAEVQSMLYVMEDLEYLGKTQINQIRQQAAKTRNYTLGLIKYLKNNPQTKQK